ncbi:hypothetical protein EYC84_007335 [Monilinia fructicola]|uniref:Uncharacterized protein n=1 Tax=Monilinia fructicola TaxID=38448 RepID=A0A5M9JK14_MONFR|nr:hypothetical protein EYC84_007335 [Monilinia fructicola]
MSKAVKNVSSHSATANDLTRQKIVDHIQTTSEDVNEGQWQGTRSVKEVKPRELPLSPLMDPAFLEARNKHSAPKPRPSKERTAFQEQLAKNPYALALGNPWVEKMREGNGIFKNQILVVKHKNATKEIQMKLWKLQGYVATYGGFSSYTEDKPAKVPKAKGINFKPINLAEDLKPARPGTNIRGSC